jgi:hypothetical protein
MGDGGGSGDPWENGQDLGTRLGKLLRIGPLDPDGGGQRHYSIPAGNPYVGQAGRRGEIWSSGLRNPWRFSFDRATGDLWIGDVGQSRREEVDRDRAGADGVGAGRGLDFGWDGCEGSLEFEAKEGDADGICEHDTLPIHDYGHGAARCSVTGGYVHRGPADTAWRGLYVAGDYCGRLFVLGQGGRVLYTRATPRRISSLGEDAAGRIFLADHANGHIYRVRFFGPRPG